MSSKDPPKRPIKLFRLLKSFILRPTFNFEYLYRSTTISKGYSTVSFQSFYGIVKISKVRDFARLDVECTRVKVDEKSS